MTPVALLVPYWPFFEATTGFDLRGDREELAGAVIDLLGGDTEVKALFVDSEVSGQDAARRLATHAPQAVIVLVTMASPPHWTLTALGAVPAAPLVVCALARHSGYDRLNHEAITVNGATVGAAQLTNLLNREGRPHVLQYTAWDCQTDRESLAARVRSARAAGAVQTARVIRVGRPIPGYDCVDCDEVALATATGIEFVHVEPADVRREYDQADPRDIRAVESDTAAAFDVLSQLTQSEGWRRSMRFAAGLAQLDERLNADAGVMNCHVPEIRFANQPGITPCFALGRETTRGRPWSCTGDVLTAVAMLTLKRLGADALYHEIEVLDERTGEALLANSGEHDLALADCSLPPTLVENGWWPQDRVRGVCACFGVAPGPATLVAFTPHPDEPSGFRYLVAQGTFTGRRLPETATPHASFRFAHGSLRESWARWASAGSNHHAAATRGHWGAAIEDVAAHLRIGCVRVS